jgi:hypothetical protein
MPKFLTHQFRDEKVNTAIASLEISSELRADIP